MAARWRGAHSDDEAQAQADQREVRRGDRGAVRVALAGLTLLAAALRFSTLDLQSYELDEVVTAQVLDGSLGTVLGRIPDSESTPPLYYLLAWLWSRPFGLGEVGLRSLSALIGTATVPVAYWAARGMLPARPALVAAALVAVNPLLVWEGQEARSYALLALLGVASFGFFARERPVGWAATSAAAIATHYFAAFLVVPMAVWMLTRRAWAAVGAVALVGLALLPLALDQRGHGGADALIRDSGSLGLRVRQVPKQWLVGFDAPLEGVLALVGLVCCAVAAWCAFRCEQRALKVALGVVAASVALPLLLALVGFDYLNARNLLAGLPVALVAVAAGAVRREGLAAAGVLVAMGVTVVVAVFLEPRYQRDDWRGAAEALGRAPVERAVLLRPAEPVALAYYLPGAGPYEGRRVREAVWLSLALREPGRPREVPAPPATLATFRRIDVVNVDGFAFGRYRSPAPAPAPAPRGAALLLQGP